LELAENTVSNQPVKFREIFDTYHPIILRYLTRIVGQSEAEDVTQEVLIKVSKGLQQFRGDSSINTWIYRIATNCAIDRLRGRSERQPPDSEHVMTVEDSDNIPEQESCCIESESPSVETGVIRKEMSQCVLEYVNRLSENYRAVLVLSELEGLSNAEIADIIGISLDSVKIRLHRARQKLHQELSTGCNFHRDERNEFACARKS
jgi:RNA polymerase sigma-70 factor (ECF subfamily)